LSTGCIRSVLVVPGGIVAFKILWTDRPDFSSAMLTDIEDTHQVPILPLHLFEERHVAVPI